MKKIIMVLLAVALVFPPSAMAEISVLKGEEVTVDHQFDQGASEWWKRKDREKLFLVIDAVAGTPRFTVNGVEVIFYWKEYVGDEVFKYYERINATIDLGADIQIVDLGRENKVALTLSLEFDDNGASVIDLGFTVGEQNKKGFIKYLKGKFIHHVYDAVSGDIIEFGKDSWELYRTKDFDEAGTTATEIADAIVSYLEGKGFVPEPGG